MPDLSPRKLIDAFANASRQGPAFNGGHKLQLDKLRDIVDAINADGTFTAELTHLEGKVPALRFQHKDDQQPITFRLELVSPDFSEAPNTALFQHDSRLPVGKPRGYSLDLNSDREAFLNDLGQAIALRRHEEKLREESLKYLANKKSLN